MGGLKIQLHAQNLILPDPEVCGDTTAQIKVGILALAIIELACIVNFTVSWFLTGTGTAN